MTGQQAKQRLSACRWAYENRHDPYFAAALDRAAQEPALGEWWAQQRELDALLAEKMCALPVPAALVVSLRTSAAATP